MQKSLQSSKASLSGSNSSEADRLADKKHHGYLIISPDPSERRELAIQSKSYRRTWNRTEEPANQRYLDPGSDLHFIEFGDQKGIVDRVKGYRTHNPTFWWRTITIAEAVPNVDHLGNYLEDTFSKAMYKLESGKPYEIGEWYGVQDKGKGLNELCTALDSGKDAEKVPAGDYHALNWWTNDFKNKDNLNKVFRESLA